MSPHARETVESIQAALEPRVRLREEMSHIRRVLALHLLSSYENGPETGALALLGPDCIINSTTGVRGVQRDYLKALHANIKAKQDQEVVRQAVQEGRPPRISATGNATRLEEHVTSIKLERKRARLQAVEKYLEALAQKPAAAPEFVQREEIFKDGHRLPDVPKTVVSGFAVNNGSAKPDLEALVDRLEKAVLRSKLLLKKEEQLLEDVRSRSTSTPETITEGSKLVALSATRNELIGWMEAELGKASHLDDPQQSERDGKQQPVPDRGHVHEQLAAVKDKYTKYVAARKSLAQLVQQPTQTVEMKVPSRNTSDTQRVVARTTLSAHLIMPYIEGLVQVGQAQRSYIAQKSHINAVFAKQTGESIRAVVRLSKESQVIPEHPVPGAARVKTGLGTNPSSNHVDKLSDHVQPWVSAADTAKLATLEAVAEKIEQGQVALENSTRFLAEIDQLLGRNTITGGDPMTDEDTTIDDIWLAESLSPRNGPTSKAHAKNKSNVVKEKQDIWSTLDGSVGLINAEDSPRKLL
ncbi:hypothetical protein DHEL01_v211411 [Diaporthe helianthi]|uniref:Uncharacterized protein n=1 Tax=Diaporthe helianthi TaxID=158607 RepID=A0A2P5HIW6_DIAHE|nr:hypothetical protein DHEL01_v211411 [Diaporthe helianthi]